MNLSSWQMNFMKKNNRWQHTFKIFGIFHYVRANRNLICLTRCYIYNYRYTISGHRHSLTPLYVLLSSQQSCRFWDNSCLERHPILTFQKALVPVVSTDKRVTGWETSTGGERASAHAATDVGEGAEVRGESAQWVGQEQRQQEAGAVGWRRTQSADATDSAAQSLVTLWTRGQSIISLFTTLPS